LEKKATSSKKIKKTGKKTTTTAPIKKNQGSSKAPPAVANVFDPTDKKFQLSPEFPPSKESTWPYPKEKDGWMIAHDAIRLELTDLRKTLDAVVNRSMDDGIAAWEIKALQDCFDVHFIHVHAHHSNEDDIVVAEMKNRIKLLDKIATDHDHLLKMMNELEDRMTGLNNRAAAAAPVDHNDMLGIVKLFYQYDTDMRAHLIEEEDTTLPLMRAYYTKEEMEPFIMKIIEKSPAVELGSFIHCLGVDEYRNEFMVQENIPPFLWSTVFQGKYDTFVKRFIGNVDALLTGNAPKNTGGLFACCQA